MSNTKNNTYIVLEKLGCEGSTSEVWKIKHKNNGEIYALKKFNPRIPQYKIKKEIAIQTLASENGCAPKIYFFDLKQKFIIMDLIHTNLYDEIRSNNGNISIQDQYQIYNLFKKLDSVKIFHQDPNPLNFMKDIKGTIFLIDYGMADILEKNTSQNCIQSASGLVLKLKLMFPQTDYSVITMDVPQQLKKILQI